MLSNDSFFIGIDPGARGGVAVISCSGLVKELVIMPTIGHRFDPSGFNRIITSFEKKYPIATVGLEKVSPIEAQGRKSAFAFGQYFGEVKGILIAMKFPLRLIPPNEWQLAMHRGTCSSLKPKNRSLEAVSLLWPQQSFLASDKSRVPHDGLYEAALIAEYTRRTHLGLTLAPKGEVAEEAPHAP